MISYEEFLRYLYDMHICSTLIGDFFTDANRHENSPYNLIKIRLLNQHSLNQFQLQGLTEVKYI